MQPGGKEIFLRSFEKREEKARLLASIKAESPEDSAVISGNGSPARQVPKEWTVLCYIDGHNDLEPYAAYSMLDLEAAGSDKNVNVVAELGRISQDKLKEINAELGRPYEPTNIDGDWSGVRRYHVMKDDPANPGAVREINSPVIADLGDVDMSNPKTLSDFVTWGIKNYPAKHYLVVLMDHGGGWRGAFTDDATAGGNHIMTTPQIGEAFKTVKAETGVKPDVIDMVACLMGSGEVAYEMKDAANFYCGSEEIATTDSFAYSPNIEFLQKNVASGGQFSSRDLAKHLVDYYADKPNAFVTKSAMDLSQADNLKNAINELATALTGTDTKPEIINDAIKKAQNFSRNYYIEYYSHFRDLYGIASEIAKSDQVKDPVLKKAAQGVTEAVKNMVVARENGPYTREELLEQSISPDGKENVSIMKISQGVMDSEGISIYAPIDRKYTDSPTNMARYKELQLSKDTGWDEFLKSHNEQA